MNETVKMPSGVTISIPRMTPEEAERRCYLTHEMLDLMHLAPVGQPAAFSGEAESPVFYYDPSRVTEAAPELWYKPLVDRTKLHNLFNFIFMRLNKKFVVHLKYKL